jgi:hypothetical protein
MGNNIFKQRDVRGIGAFINVLYLTAPMIGMVAYVMSAITMYTVIKPYLNYWFPWMSIGVFFAILFVAFLVALLIFYKFIYPSYWAFQNRQVYIHKNPMQKDLELIKKKLGIEDENDKTETK